MLKATMKYGAIRAKVMAMQGKMLTPEDIDKLCDCAGFMDVVTFLRAHKGWGEVVAKLPSPITPQSLSEAVSAEVWHCSEKLYHFASGDDKTFYKYSIGRGEYAIILAALRRLNSLSPDRPAPAPEFLRRRTRLDLDSLRLSMNWQDILAATKNTDFYEALAALPVDSETGLPNYSDACVALENEYYKSLFQYLSKSYRGLGKPQLVELTGRQADMLNIISLLRLQRHFPGSLGKAQKLLIPISYRLKPELTQSIISARSEAEAESVIRASQYGKFFADTGGERLESLYEKALGDYCRSFMRSAEPSLATAQAGLTLKELECSRLLRIIEAVNLGVDPHRAV